MDFLLFPISARINHNFFLRFSLLERNILWPLIRHIPPYHCIARGRHSMMESQVVKRSIKIDGHKTSVSLEDPFWKQLKEIAHKEENL
jgi:Ribbon-helix-helix domain